MTIQKNELRGVVLNLEYQESFIKAAKAAHNVTEFLNIEKYPFPIVEVIKKDKEVQLFTFTEFAKMTKADKRDIAIAAGTDEAFHIKQGKKKAIVYNEFKYEKRLRFTLAHEYGHLKMNHAGSNIRSIEKSDRNIMMEEYEANSFASCLLFPINIRYRFQDVMDANEISELFNISHPAAEIAMDIFNTHMDSGLDDFFSTYEHQQHSSYISFLEEMYHSKREYYESIMMEYRAY